jgi:hypothetical protein
MINMKQIDICSSTILLTLRILMLFVFITLNSCGRKAEQAPMESPDSTAVEDYTTYCCGNHSPAHCGVNSELEDLTKAHGCKDFGTR